MSLSSLLNEFDRLERTDPPEVSHWVDRHAALAGCRGLQDLLDAIQHAPDATLAALIAEAHAGSPLAALVVARALVPKLIVLAARDPHNAVEDYLSQLWLRIADYPLDRRPVRIAANLSLDTRKSLWAEHRQGLTVIGYADELSSSPVAREPDSRTILRTAEQLGLVDPRTHAVMLGVFSEGLSRTTVARRHRVTTRTIDRRCHRGIRTLAAHSQELLAAL